MKLFLIVLLISTPGFAANWIAKSKVKGPHTAYSKKKKCEQVEGEICFNKELKDVRRWKAGFRPINIPSTMDCNDSLDCDSKRTGNDFGCPSGEVVSFDDKANWPGLDFTTDARLNTGWFLWCQREQLVFDSVGDAAATSEDSQKASDEAARDSAKGGRTTRLNDCVQNTKGGGTMPGAQVKQCLKALVREVMQRRVDPADL